MLIFCGYLYFWPLYVCRGSQLDPIRSKGHPRALQHIYMYRCKNSTIGFIIMIFKLLNLRAFDKRFKSLDGNFLLKRLHFLGNRGQKTEDRGQRTENRRLMTEN
jgi:hypothetical protein